LKFVNTSVLQLLKVYDDTGGQLMTQKAKRERKNTLNQYMTNNFGADCDIIMNPEKTLHQGISVVTTTLNEKENIIELIQRIHLILKDSPHEIIVIDDGSPDGTLEIAKQYADIAISKQHEGQTSGLLFGVKLAKFPLIITIDADLENPPELIPIITQKLVDCDVVVASRRALPRFSEKWAAKTLGKICNTTDFYSNFRAYKKEVVAESTLRYGETFGGELLILAKKHGYKVCDLEYDPPPRRGSPRIGGTIKANFRINIATIKCFLAYLF
jgi:dolichol-phosphate mannosyltransferase